MASHPEYSSWRATPESMSSYITARQSTSSHRAMNGHTDDDQESLNNLSTSSFNASAHRPVPTQLDDKEISTKFGEQGGTKKLRHLEGPLGGSWRGCEEGGEGAQSARRPPADSPGCAGPTGPWPGEHHVVELPELTRSTSTVDPYTSASITPIPHTPVSAIGAPLHSWSVRTESLPSIRGMGLDEGRLLLTETPQSSAGYDGGDCIGHMLKQAPRCHEENCIRGEQLSADDSSEWEDIDSDNKTAGEGRASPGVDTSLAWVDELPSHEDVRNAADCHVIDEWGDSIRFGDLLPGGTAWSCSSNGGPPVSRLVVLFVGHWWCGLCHDYALVSVTKLSPAVLFREGVRVVLISSGSWKPIKKYRAMFNVPFPVFVDPGTRLFKSLGLRRGVPNPIAEARLKQRPSYHRHVFVRQMITGMANGIFRLGGIRFNHPGRFTQLGGEFVFSSGYRCDFAHRMTNRADHCEAPDVLGAVGVNGTLGDPVCSAPPPALLQRRHPRRGRKAMFTDDDWDEKQMTDSKADR